MSDPDSDRDQRSDQQEPEQQEEARDSRSTGGDAEAAASISEREAAARDESPFQEDSV